MSEPSTVNGSQSGAYGDLADLARLAYIYGFPAYEMARLRWRAFNGAGVRRPWLNTLRHKTALTTPTDGAVTNTNADVLKSTAWLDLSRYPLFIRVPDGDDRYHSLALMDFFTNNFAVLGRRTSGTIAGDFCLVGPQWTGAIPNGLSILRAPTNGIWALVRIMVRSPDDLTSARALQGQYAISAWPINNEESAQPDLAYLSGFPDGSARPLSFFEVLNGVLTENPPPAQDAVVLDRLRPIGVGAGLEFNRRGFNAPQLTALRRGLSAARHIIRGPVGPLGVSSPEDAAEDWPSDALLARMRSPNEVTSGRILGARSGGWSRPAETVGNFGTDYLRRARCALRGIGGLTPEDALYFVARTDAAGVALGGEGCFVLRFPSGGTPPVYAFWSLTVYRIDENNRRWLVPNAIQRYSIGNLTPGLRYDDDGSLRIFIQHHRPADHEENWLPAPAGGFIMTLRAYQPRRELLDGSYVLPNVQRSALR